MSRNSDFIERSLVGALFLLRENILSDDFARKRGLMQSIGPRLKVVLLFSFLLAVLFTENILALAFLYFLCLLLTCLSRIRLGYFLKRTWVFIPLFSLFIAIPAIFSNFSPGEVLITIRLFSFEFIITKPGVAGAVLFVARVATSVSFVVLLGLTTRHTRLLAALRSFGLPQLFVLTLGMCYRYIYLLAGLVIDTYRAIKSRAGAVLHYKKGQNIVAWHIAYLWKRSYKLNEDVYNAMLSRGFSGEWKALR